jgi:hypothetical protein
MSRGMVIAGATGVGAESEGRIVLANGLLIAGDVVKSAF